MPNIGDQLPLPVIKEIHAGLLLDADSLGEILLPHGERITTNKINPTVFIYRDSEDRPIATEKSPKILPGQFGILKVLASNHLGAFLDWGLAKDLLLPISEQRHAPKTGTRVVVHVYLDPKSNRLVASQRISRFLNPAQIPPPYSEGQEVDLLIFAKSPLGYQAIVDQKFSGLLFANQTFEQLYYADQLKGYVAQVRPDHKIDLSLTPLGRDGEEALAQRLQAELAARGGFWELSDRSPADLIYAELGVSKKLFKKVLGGLYKKRLISFENTGIRLTPSSSQ